MNYFNITPKWIKSFDVDEGTFSVYDIIDDIRDRGDMFTVFESESGWVIRNVFIPTDLRRKGLATSFYIKMNKESINKTGNQLKSTQSKYLSSGEYVHELSSEGTTLWDSFVAKGLATKIGDKNYRFN